MEKPMTTLYLTGHSLGGAMAALMAVMLSVEPDYLERFARMFKGASTFGAPMVGSPEFAKACAANTFLHRNVVRYVYRKDLVPHLPPSDSDAGIVATSWMFQPSCHLSLSSSSCQ